MTGLATDGGLYVPEYLPQFSEDLITSWSSLTYEELAFKVMYPFVEDNIDEISFQRILDKSYAKFRDTSIAPLKQFDEKNWILELFHGPTLAFKDFALQFLGNLLDHIVGSKNEKLVVLGATSGDTGSAAIEGCKDCRNIDVFILHPHNRVSDVQRRQMTTIYKSNIHNIAISGNFDDCQAIVKKSFSKQEFLRGERRLIAVNSINFARILAQIVYYFWSYLRINCPKEGIIFSVPTGNFGDVFAGYIALGMGLPIKKLIVATNSNDILHRCINNNDHSPREVNASLAPSMDIMISSNFERLLFDAFERDSSKIRELMEKVTNSSIQLSERSILSIRDNFWSYRCDDREIVSTIKSFYKKNNYLLDPHTAIGVSASMAYEDDAGTPIVTLSTAHPAKFPDVSKYTNLLTPELPEHLKSILLDEEYYSIVDNCQNRVESFISKKLFA